MGVGVIERECLYHFDHKVYWVCHFQEYQGGILQVLQSDVQEYNGSNRSGKSIFFDFSEQSNKPLNHHYFELGTICKKNSHNKTTFLKKRYAKNYNHHNFWHTFFLKR